MVYLYYLLATALSFVRHGDSLEDQCFPPEWLQSVSVSMEISKAGFHRDLLYRVHWSPVDHDVKALLVQKMPSGVYMDEYQLETLRQDTGLQVLLNAKVDLEAPEYLSSGFTALVFLSGVSEAAVPLHGRYHRPSGSGVRRVEVRIEPPRLLLRSDQCGTPSARHRVAEAPCTVSNHSVCSWLDTRALTEAAGVSLEIPVGDSSLTLSVCVATVLTAGLSCLYLLRNIWKHGTF